MKTSALMASSKSYLQSASQEYWYVSKQWVFKTPERALNEAYKAALTIKSIEDDYFEGDKISIDPAKSNDYLMSLVRTDFQRELIIAKLRLAEFKTSCLILGIPVSSHLDKLRFLDEVLAKYTFHPNKPAAFAPTSTDDEIDLASEKIQPNLATVESFVVKKFSRPEINFPKSTREIFEEFKKQLHPNSDTEVAKNLQNSKHKISTAITGTAIKYILLLILLPLLYHQISRLFFQPTGAGNLKQELEHRNYKPQHP